MHPTESGECQSGRMHGKIPNMKMDVKLLFCAIAALALNASARTTVFVMIDRVGANTAADIGRICRGKVSDIVFPSAPDGDALAVCRASGARAWVSFAMDDAPAAAAVAAAASGVDGVMFDWRGRTPSRLFRERLADVRGAKRGRVKIAVRVPYDPEVCEEFGFDVVGWAKEGLVDFVVPSPLRRTASDLPVDRWAEALSGLPVCLVPDLGVEVPCADRAYAPAILRGVAANFYGQGAAGVCMHDGAAVGEIYIGGIGPGDIARFDYDCPVSMHDWPTKDVRDDTKRDALFAKRRGEYLALQSRIDAASAAGGGRVDVKGTLWCDGPVVLKSGVELHFSDGARLVFNDNPERYPAVMSSWEGVECLNHSPLIYAFGATNVAVTGRGTIAPRMERWMEWIPRTPEHMAATRKMYDWCSFAEPVENRDLTKVPGANARPQLMMFNRCANVRLEDFRVRQSPFWVMHLFLCRDVLVKDVDVIALGNNNDGLDIEMSRNVLVEGCSFRQGDDAICIKAGRNRDGWRLAAPSENIEIRNCTIHRGNSVVGIGSEMSGGVRNVWIHDCVFDFFGGSLLHLKTNERRGGFIENIRMENCTAKNVKRAVVAVETDVLYQWKNFPTHEVRVTPITDLVVRNVAVERANRLLMLKGDARCPIRNVTVENVTCGTTYAKDIVANAEGVTVR